MMAVVVTRGSCLEMGQPVARRGTGRSRKHGLHEIGFRDRYTEGGDIKGRVVFLLQVEKGICRASL